MGVRTPRCKRALEVLQLLPPQSGVPSLHQSAERSIETPTLHH